MDLVDRLSAFRPVGYFWDGQVGVFAGTPVQHDPQLDADCAFIANGVLIQGTRTDSPGYGARQIVREGLADVLAWLAEARRR